MLEEGSKAPDFTLDQADGPPLTLGETVGAGHKVLLIFFRHLG